MHASISSTNNFIGEEIILKGRLKKLRKLSKFTFFDLTDSISTIQCIYLQKITDLNMNDYVEIKGIVKKRSESNLNESSLGNIEVEVLTYTIISNSKALPIPIDTDGYEVNEEMRLKYRYLDLRRDRLNSNIKLRSKLSHALRTFLIKSDFIEIETPALTKATMEGSRNFIVPSRINKGSFYALPQSPQQYKQLLMCSDFNRYFQFAKCFRDEDLRADRGFEFTQIDMEMSYMSQKEIMDLIENMVKFALNEFNLKLKLGSDGNFPVYTYEEAMNEFSADKFDLRTQEEKENNVLAFAWVVKFPFFKKVNVADEVEVNEGKSGWTFTHNPFSRPLDECTQDHLNNTNVENIYTTQYDLVCNGFEVGGGSLRAHLPEVLKSTYKIMGYKEEEIQSNIGHMLEAFEYGCPPHGGIALGLDRLAMLVAGEKSLKEVIAFPMSITGKTSVMDAPTKISPKEFEELLKN